ncbi:MAG: ATP synthase F1 subunit epsilon [Prevotellaceae bacterium]|jgi:F-type H+-transporting ATPase subunit epsilon|nr:ATP synthase F1 subunit epsilon [Prevotellaceae bacterium]
MSLHIQIVSPKGTLYEGDLLYAVFPGVAGEFAVYPDHAPIISSLKSGTIRCVVGEKSEEAIEIGGGFVEVNENNVTVCVE